MHQQYAAAFIMAVTLNVLVTGLNSLAHACCGTEQHPQVPRKHAQQRTCFCCCRSAPLPIKVDGFSMGAVMGYSEQHTLLLMTSDEEVETFLNVGQSPAQQQCDSLLREGSSRAVQPSRMFLQSMCGSFCSSTWQRAAAACPCPG